MNGGYRFYSLDFPESVDFQFSTLVRNIVKGRHAVNLIIQKEGLSPMRIVAASAAEIEDPLTSIVSGADPRCTVKKLEVLKSAGYEIALELKRFDRTEVLDISRDILAAMRSVRPDEHFRATVYARRWLRLNPRKASPDYGLLGFTVLFGGSLRRLTDIFPFIGHRRMWKVKPAFKISSPRWSPCPLTMVDNLIPSTKQTFRDRMSFPARPGTILCEGVRVSTPSGRHPLKVNEGFLRANTLLFGGTGTGKSTYLHWLALTLIREGRAVCVVDPHGTLISSIMGCLDGGAESGSVVYVDPVRCPLGLNPFEVFRTDGRQDEVSSLLVESIGHTIKEAFGSEYWGPRLDYLINGVIRAVAPLPQSNFADVMELINNPFAAKELADTTGDPSSKDFLLSIIPRARDDWWMSSIDKIGRILNNTHARTVLCRRVGNVDIGECIRDGCALLADLDMNQIGAGMSSLIGAILIAMYWIVASSVKTGATIIVDEAQLFPAEILERISSQGRKFGVNVIFASQSPSGFDRNMLAAMSSNFENKILLRLEGMDAKLVSDYFGGIRVEDVGTLGNLEALIKSRDSIGELSLEPVSARDGGRQDYISAMESIYTTVDDSLPSPLASMESQLFDMLQIVSMAEVQGKTSLGSIQETGILELMGYSMSQVTNLIARARAMKLVQRGHNLRLSEIGRNEMLRLQGGMLAGGERHRDIVVLLKAIFDAMVLICYIPRQVLGTEQPDLIVRTLDAISAILFYIEVEVSTKYWLELRRKKIERAVRNKATPVFVFDDPAPVISAQNNEEFRHAVLLWLDGRSLKCHVNGQWVELKDKEQFIKFAASSSD